jgi:hypothetical protein
VTGGPTLLAGVFFVAALAGLAAFWAAWPTNSNTSPLAALFALLWSCVYFVAAILIWRRSRLAAPAFVAAIALLLFPASRLFPGGQVFLPAVVFVGAVAFLGARFLRSVSRPRDSYGMGGRQ